MTLKRIVHDSRGATALEFALTAPVFFAIVTGIIELALVLWTQLALQQGAEAAARCASVNKNLCGTSSQIQSFAVSESYGLSPPTSAFTVSAPACGNQVDASYTYVFVFGFIGVPSLDLTAKSCFPK